MTPTIDYMICFGLHDFHDDGVNEGGWSNDGGGEGKKPATKLEFP